MSGAVLVALAAAIGNLLQGWDNATIAGSLLYIKKEFHLETQPTMEGLIVAMSLIGATIITTFSGPVSDTVGRRPLLIASSVLYFLSGLFMLWAPNVYTLLLARLLDGFGVGLAVTLVPVYISETAPPEIRGLLNTFPQLTGSGGMLFSYCMVFGMSLNESPNWRVMLGVLSIPSLVYILLAIFYLPESPRWLVSKGKIKEAKKVLQQLRSREDVSGEMALLMEGLDVGGDVSVEEYIIAPDNDLDDNQEQVVDKDQIKLYGAEEGQSWVAKPVTGQSALGLVTRRGSMAASQSSFIDPMVTLFDSVHEKLPENSGSMKSMLFSNFGSMFGVAENKTENWDEENQREGDRNVSDDSGNESDDNLRSPLLSHEDTNAGKDMEARQGSTLSQVNEDNEVSSVGIGGGWQLAYKKDERKEGALRRIYLHQEGGGGSRRGSMVSLTGGDNPAADGECVHAAALVSKSVLRTSDIMGQIPIEEAMVKKSKPTPAKEPGWKELCEPGVKHALIVGVGLQILQQFSGINGVLYYTPQILQRAGVSLLLAHLGLSPDSASILISAATTLLMLPAIGVAMKLMDLAGRRWLLLTTLPVLFLSLVTLVLGSSIDMGQVVNAVVSTTGVVFYLCCFVMGYGPIPNILCAEIFPTRVRGKCIAICALTFWICDIIVTYSLPLMLSYFGLRGVFGIYMVVCAVSWVFVFLKVPETKGMPLEVITEFFAVGAKKTSD
ncbi:PREDICTED: monosaccharide-sensing protein 2-like [Ipomoea nil]|uniref:monosaccharide-sensing protein 2-like n=1 Tax=Ipomoea nil TaxID=35883 RepID=UPI0009016769|nr:PREDICTED: monosaccharide-sensing protein 2-like [Ipomoea nil]XP_019172395.1 PREDICTED: monosaccharide-sensing protein 2-like [Ipomoea nil]